MKQIQSIAFLSKLPQETLRELCRVMKVQSYYRKDRGVNFVCFTFDALGCLDYANTFFFRASSVYSRRRRRAFFYHFGGEMCRLQGIIYATSS